MEIGMKANSFEGSAKIYQFPAGGRAGLSGRRYEAKPTDDFAVARNARVTSGSAWYHEEAIREAQGTRRN
jgi:hypothetical protein